jgi:hypothetical protein
MKRVRSGFTGSLGRDTIVITEFVSKHDHLGFRGTSPGDTSTELPYVGHCGKRLRGLIKRNKLLQQDGNHDPFVNQNTIHGELSETIQACVSFFHPYLLRCLTTKPDIFHNARDIDPFLSKMPKNPNALQRPPMYGLFQADVPTHGKKIGRHNFDHISGHFKR